MTELEQSIKNYKQSKARRTRSELTERKYCEICETKIARKRFKEGKECLK